MVRGRSKIDDSLMTRGEPWIKNKLTAGQPWHRHLRWILKMRPSRRRRYPIQISIFLRLP